MGGRNTTRPAPTGAPGRGRGEAALLVEKGPNDLAIFKLTREVSILGRGDSCDMEIDDEGVE